MEILIIGVMIVALMVYVSTKIKKSAAAAYEPETIDNADFKLIKPAGLMHPLHNDSEFLFEAYSNDYGDENLRSIWQMQAALKLYPDIKFKTVCADIKKDADKVLSEEVVKNAPADQRICLIESEKEVDGVKTRNFWKIIESLQQKKIYALKVSVLDGNLEEKVEKAAVMIESFTVK